MNREIVKYTEQHTFMFQLVRVFCDAEMCQKMLEEELTPETTRELFQTYYLAELQKQVQIEPKNHYGAWNASIKDLSNITPYLELIKNKLMGHITEQEIKDNIHTVNKITGLSKNEAEESKPLEKKLLNLFNHTPISNVQQENEAAPAKIKMGC